MTLQGRMHFVKQTQIMMHAIGILNVCHTFATQARTKGNYVHQRRQNLCLYFDAERAVAAA